MSSGDGLLMAVTESPDAESWRLARADRLVHGDAEVAAMLGEALLPGEGEGEPVALTVIDDKLIRQATGAASVVSV